jgi:hypothetical protein
MKPKQNFSVKPIVKYLREVSVVVIGVAITVGIGLWINNNNIRKDQKQYLDAILLELKENAEKFDDYAKDLRKSVGYSNYLHSLHRDIKSISKDSIDYYAFDNEDGLGWGSWNPVILYTEDAFEMFKSSGAMRQVDDKELLLSIWKVYNLMRSTQNIIDGLLQHKKEVAMMEDDHSIARMWSFYMNNIPQSMVYHCEGTTELIRETVSKLEKSEIVK